MVITMGSRALIYMKTPEGWYYKYSHWGASHLIEGLAKEEFWKDKDKNAIKPVFRSAKGYLDGRWKKVNEETYNFIENFDVEAILMFEKPVKGRIPDKALLFETPVAINDSIPNGAIYVLDKIKSPFGCTEKFTGFLWYVEGFIHALYGKKEIPQGKIPQVIKKVFGSPWGSFTRQRKNDKSILFLGAHREYPLDALLFAGEVIRKGKVRELSTLDEIIQSY